MPKNIMTVTEGRHSDTTYVIISTLSLNSPLPQKSEVQELSSPAKEPIVTGSNLPNGWFCKPRLVPFYISQEENKQN